MGFFSELFGATQGDQGSPSDAAMQYLNQIPGVGQQYYNPFIERGNQAYGVNQPIYNQMAQDPNKFLQSIIESYNPSEGYKFKQKNLTQAAQNAAAQGGYAGTPYSQMEQSDLVRGLLGEDMQQFLSNILGIQGAGLQGGEQRINQGYNASSALADMIASNLSQQAGVSYTGQQQRNLQDLTRTQHLGNLFDSGLNAGARLLGQFGTRGGFF